MAWKLISKILKCICWVIRWPSASWIKWLENYYINISIFKKKSTCILFWRIELFFSRKDQRIHLKFDGKVNEIVQKINSLGVLFSILGSFERPRNIYVIKRQKIYCSVLLEKKFDCIIYLWTFKLIYLTKWLQESYSCFVIWLGRTRFKKIIDVFECLQFI